MQRLGEELKRLHRINTHNLVGMQETEPIIKNYVLVISSDAIDFAALHGENGRIVIETHPNYRQHRNITLKRYKTLQFSTLSTEGALESNPYTHDLLELCINQLGLQSEDITSFIKNGPILPELHDFLHSSADGIDGFHPEILHCTYLPYTTLLYALLIGKKFNIPTAITPFLHEENSRYNLKQIIQVLNKFSAIVACTEYEKKIYIENGIVGQKIAVIPMGVDNERFTPPNKPMVQESIPSTALSVLFCGNKNFEKGALTLLNAIPYVLTQTPDVEFCFIGAPTKAYNYTLDQIKKVLPEVKIRNLTPENLTGVFDPQKIHAFQQAAVYCMPSRSEAYGIAYLEAWASKKPVIAADFPPMHEVVQVNEDGLLVPFDNPKCLAEKICYLLKNPLIRHEMGEKGYSKIVHNNTWYQIAQSTYKLYQRCSEEKW